jgi:hypothetical protein
MRGIANAMIRATATTCRLFFTSVPDPQCAVSHYVASGLEPSYARRSSGGSRLFAFHGEKADVHILTVETID